MKDQQFNNKNLVEKHAINRLVKVEEEHQKAYRKENTHPLSRLLFSFISGIILIIILLSIYYFK
ncbi:membrane protein insertase Oxa1/YidC/SpoIIIJ [Lactobacillus colini]|uniref:Membrane protein insertase Oxa1/YidC/SpoIIIJ n=1 Tax=Lactobacillus colini TaxID=1819254 RepID=A0ABS4MGN4_9LACO|nr:hypothetical protein [Lactobacillus colini]MBP2058868.1 membrane protein insertase Oxa1/YidC/SpoIIIJ [Lactobacillus colini]